MKISILIPAVNEEHYIDQCLTTLVEMQKKYAEQNIPIEIIVCDNNSTDTTAEKVRAYAPNVILVSEPQKGAHAARQKAFSVSTGEIIATTDADCIPNADWIDRALTHFQNSNVISVGGMCEYSKDYRYAWAITAAERYLFPPLHFLTTKIIKNGGMMVAGNAWFRRSVLEKIGGFDTTFEFYGDDTQTAFQIEKIKEKKQIMLYDTKLIVQTSSRRFQKIGFWKTLYLYIANDISIRLSKNSDTQ